MAWMETDCKHHSEDVSMEDKMAAGAFGHSRNYGRDGAFDSERHAPLSQRSSLEFHTEIDVKLKTLLLNPRH